MKIITVDPGGTTGIAEYNTVTEDLLQFQIGPDEHHDELNEYLWASLPNVIVCERFNYQRRDLEKGVSLVLVSREYIGVCKRYVQWYNRINKDNNNLQVELAMQQPSCMGLFTDRKLKKIGVYRPAMVHANDATRHLFYYMTTEMKDNKWIFAAREPE